MAQRDLDVPPRARPASLWGAGLFSTLPAPWKEPNPGGLKRCRSRFAGLPPQSKTFPWQEFRENGYTSLECAGRAPATTVLSPWQVAPRDMRKKRGGRGDHTRCSHHTRPQGAQFSLGKAKLVQLSRIASAIHFASRNKRKRQSGAAAKILSIFGSRFVSFGCSYVRSDSDYPNHQLCR